MALRYLARRVGAVGIPAARVSPPTTGTGGGRPLACRSSQHQAAAGYFNGATSGARKMYDRNRWSSASLAETTKSADHQEIDDDLAAIKASFREAREAIEHGRRMEKLAWRCYIGSGVAGVALGLYAFAYVARKVREAAREEAKERGTWV